MKMLNQWSLLTYNTRNLLSCGVNPNDLPCQMRRQSSHFWRKTHWETAMNGHSGNKWTIELLNHNDVQFSLFEINMLSTLFIVLDEERLISDDLFLFSCSFFSFSIRAAAKAIILSLINYDLTKPCHKVINLSIYQQISVENYSNFPSSFEYLFLEFLKSFLIVLLQFCPDKQVTFSFLVCKLTFLSC